MMLVVMLVSHNCDKQALDYKDFYSVHSALKWQQNNNIAKLNNSNKSNVSMRDGTSCLMIRFITEQFEILN